MEDDFAPLSLGSTLQRVIHVFLKRWKAFLVISSLVYLAGLLFAMLTALLMGNDLKIDGFSIRPQLFGVNFHSSSSGVQSTTYSGAHFESWSSVVYTLELLIYYCFSCVAHGATIWLATHLYLEQYPSILDGFWNAGTKVLALTCSLVLIALINIAFAMFIVALFGRDSFELAVFLVFSFTLFLGIVFYHVYPSIMVENSGALQALSRSWEISNGHWCLMFCILLLWGCFRYTVGFLISLIVQPEITYVYYGVQDAYSWRYYVAQALDIGFGILFLSLESVFQTVLYLRNRAANESLDKVGLASELGSTEDGDYITMTNNNNRNNAPSNEKAGDETRSEDPKILV